MTFYTLHSISPWISVRSLIRRKLWTFQDYLYLLFFVQLTYLSSQRAYVKFHLRNYYDHNFHEHTSLRSPKRTFCLNPMRYHDASIENRNCYRILSIMNQSIGNIWSTYDLICRSKPLLTLAQLNILSRLIDNTMKQLGEVMTTW